MIQLIKARVFSVILIILISSLSHAQTEGKIINIKSFQAVGDGRTDDTKAIQQAILMASAGDTVFIPEGKYLVKSLGLRSGIHIKSDGVLIQKIEGEAEEFSHSRQNSSAPLFRGNNVTNISLRFKAETQNEALYLTGSENIHITQSIIKGDSTQPMSFPGILLYDCRNISITSSTISHYGAPRAHPEKYQPGTGIRILASDSVTVINNRIYDNGENGVFMHNTPNVNVSNNKIQNNGMSAIQVGFGTQEIEKNYRFIGNLMEGNAADAIDINNRSTKTFHDINCLIDDNISRNNGFVKGKSTPDGSGIATLINVSGVRMSNNIAENNNRPALYIETCGKIEAYGNKADNQVEIVLEFDELIMDDNTFGFISLLSNVKGKKLLLTNNELHSLSLPNGIQVDSLIIRDNLISNAKLNFNLTGHVSLIGNTINSNATDGAILIVRTNNVLLERNRITSTKSNAVVIRKMAEQVSIINNDIKSVNTCILDDGSKGLKVKNNDLLSLEGGRFRHTLVSRNPDQLILTGNAHTTIRREDALRLEGVGTAWVIAERVIRGSVDYGSVKVRKKWD